ncbi:MAG: mycofactocin precursor MftA [Acidimicrobiales bacterium]|jgi:mycofactocin precursor
MTVTTTEETVPATADDQVGPMPATADDQVGPMPATADDQVGPMPATADPAPLVAGDLLVEDVSIDGMCGVY